VSINEYLARMKTVNKKQHPLIPSPLFEILPLLESFIREL
jgi:hypothetical protein